jgi:hypothetical protein
MVVQTNHHTGRSATQRFDHLCYCVVAYQTGPGGREGAGRVGCLFSCGRGEALCGSGAVLTLPAKIQALTTTTAQKKLTRRKMTTTVANMQMLSVPRVDISS